MIRSKVLSCECAFATSKNALIPMHRLVGSFFVYGVSEQTAASCSVEVP